MMEYLRSFGSKKRIVIVTGIVMEAKNVKSLYSLSIL